MLERKRARAQRECGKNQEQRNAALSGQARRAKAGPFFCEAHRHTAAAEHGRHLAILRADPPDPADLRR